MIPTRQCSICLDSQPYDKCAGEGCARLVRPICDRSDAVNLAQGVVDEESAAALTAKGVLRLAHGVLIMDEYIRGMR